MKRNQQSILWGALLILLLGGAGVLQLQPVRAGGPTIVVSGAAAIWDGNPATAAITPDTGALGILDANTARVNLLAAAAAWEAIPSSSITLPDTGPDNSITGPEGVGDFAVSNFMNYVGSCGPFGNPQISPMIFDNEDDDSNGNGDIFDALGFSSGVVGLAAAECRFGSTIVEGYAIFNGPAVRADDPTGENFRGVMTHELGHFLNFGHSVVNGHALLAGDSQFPDGTPLVPQTADIETMYPFVQIFPGGTGKEAATPHQDDIAIASTIYPDPSVPLSSFGTIKGTLSDAPSTPRTGGQIIARRVGNRYQDAVSAISGDFLQADTPGAPLRGTYTLNMLTPGESYTLEVRDTVEGNFSTPVFVAPGGTATTSLGPLPGPEEFYSGPTESHSLSFDDPTAAPFFIPVSTGGPSSPVVADIMLSASTVLVANFMNGNNAALNSRVYLWNSSTAPGDVTVRIFSLPLKSGMAQELSAPLNLATLAARSARNLKVAEDILVPAGITTPYTNDGGNLTLEFTVQAPRVRGAAQVFSSGFAFGTYPLQEMPATSGGSPTFLVANFMNGNNAAFNSRIYLWNPSTSNGNITVRVFTLPLSGGTAQELTTTPLFLGTLGARSALNLKLAEDILTPLGISLPYTTDGGNLTLEFTIQAADVQGAAQVFSDSFAFGTYALQSVPSAPSIGSTVLAANFMNGNNTAFNARVYLYNPSNDAGDITVRVFTLPLSGGLAQELTTTPLNLGSLASKSAVNLKLAEDILTPLGMTPPYTTDGGNLTLEFTIQAADVQGAAQVFSDSFAFGTYALQSVPSISSIGPTVLAANFMNGNNSAFNARLYLFNPSNSAGDITVRVFTLPLTGGAAQELTSTPLNLGSLAAESAVNLKLAEDILTPLGITLPYTTDGGNLTLEFTIQAGDVRGAAQVFSPSFAFGTYPLQEIPSISQGSPTILSAEFMNGNNGAFNSRVYLWNPSNSPGSVTVRVFTLPLNGGLAQELTPTPLFLGSLGAKSALNLKLDEDILTPLGITPPYTTDGGNL
ncbi:MAG: hypothetical protein IH937_14590, partial [Acidobacteria bacterium]|nr:hypothetical protein [Acidobacteriota bacterium]